MEAGVLLTSMEVGGSRWKLSWKQMKLLNEATSMDISMELNGSTFTSTEISMEEYFLP